MSFPRAIAMCALMTAVVAIASAQERARQTTPVLVKEVRADYTKEAREARIEGIVRVGAVVLKDGSVGDVNVTKSLDQQYGLDEQAVKSVKQWRFKPGTKDGEPVDVVVSIEVSFKLK